MTPVGLRMPLKKNRPRQWNPVRIFLAMFVAFCVVFFTFHIYIYGNKKSFIAESLQRTQRHEVTIFAESLAEHFEWLVNDLNFIVALYGNSRYAQSAGATECDDLVADLLAFSRASKIYDQIRFIDTLGVERIRINYNDGRPVSVPVAELQDKKDRYYVGQAQGVAGGKIYLSPLDLNVEGAAVERPFKPMLRVAVAVRNARDEQAGIIVLNYFGDHLLRHIREQHALRLAPDMGEFSLLNADGYWLLAENPEDEWGFMFSDRKEQRFGNRYPKEWATILAGEDGAFASANGLFTFTTVRARSEGLAAGDGYFWKLVSRLPLDKADSLLARERTLFVVIGILLACLAAALAGGGVYFYHRKLLYEEELQKLASSDPLTGLLNRRAFLDRLLFEKARFDRHGGSLVLIMADVDHFKQVNDQHGHDAGDYILRRVSKILQGRMRFTDVLCRWGGEEFMLLLAGNDEVDGRFVAEKVRSLVESELFTFNGRDIPVTMSLGVAFFKKGMAPEQCIQLADQRLYYSKKNGRNRVTATDLEEAGAVGGE